MDNIKISKNHIQMLIAMFISGSTLITGGLTDAKQDTWLCVVAAYLLSLPLCWLFASLVKLPKDRDFFSGIIQVCGKIPGRILCFLYALNAVHLCGQNLRFLAEFVHDVNMNETPLTAILVCVLIAAIYAVRNRLYVLVRLAGFALPFIFASVGLTILLSVQDMDFTNMLPVLHLDWKQVSSGTFEYFSLAFGELVFCLPLLGAIDHQETVFPVLAKGSLMGFLLLLTVSLRNLFVLGYTNGVSAFPSYSAVSIISIGEFFTRIEVLIGINLLFSGFFKILVLLFFTCKSFSAALGFKDYEPLAGPCGILSLTTALLIFCNTGEMFSWQKYFAYFSLPLQLIAPAILLIIGKIRGRLKPGSTAKAEAPKPGTSRQKPAPPDRRAGRPTQAE